MRGLMVITTFIMMNTSYTMAQSIWVPPSTGSIITLEILKPSFATDLATTRVTSVQILTLRVPFHGSDRLVIELPFAHADVPVATVPRSGFISSSFFSSNSNTATSENVIGNPYVGIELGEQDLYFEYGVRLPFHRRSGDWDNLALVVGSSAVINRVEAYSPDFNLSFNGIVNYKRTTESGITIRLRGGPLFSFPRDESNGTEAFMIFSGQLWYETQYFTLGGGVSGRTIFLGNNLSGLSLAERTIQQLGFTIAHTAGRVRPGIHVRLPLDDDLSNIFNVVYGFNVGIQLN